jgi:hypothetical protein
MVQIGRPVMKKKSVILVLSSCALTTGVQTLAGTMGAASISSSLKGITSSAALKSLNSANSSVKNQ